jgi:hypothetical protein
MHVFLSYPKSGRTWIRFMVDSYLCQLFDLSCDNVFEAETRLRDKAPIEWTHLTGAMIMKRPYWAMGPIPLGRAAGVPWLMLVRNFQATLASAYFQARDRIKVFEGTPSEFVRDPRYGVVKLVTFYNLWEQIRPSLSSVTMFCFEDFRNETKEQFARVVEALHLPLEEDLLEQSVAAGSFDAMKRLSVTQAYRGTPLAPTDRDRPETFKVRQAGGGEGGARELFTPEDQVFIARVVDDLFLHKDDPIYQRCLGQPGRTTKAPAAADS